MIASPVVMRRVAAIRGIAEADLAVKNCLYRLLRRQRGIGPDDADAGGGEVVDDARAGSKGDNDLTAAHGIEDGGVIPAPMAMFSVAVVGAVFMMMPVLMVTADVTTTAFPLHPDILFENDIAAGDGINGETVGTAEMTGDAAIGIDRDCDTHMKYSLDG